MHCLLGEWSVIAGGGDGEETELGEHLLERRHLGVANTGEEIGLEGYTDCGSGGRRDRRGAARESRLDIGNDTLVCAKGSQELQDGTYLG